MCIRASLHSLPLGAAALSAISSEAALEVWVLALTFVMQLHARSSGACTPPSLCGQLSRGPHADGHARVPSVGKAPEIISLRIFGEATRLC